MTRKPRSLEATEPTESFEQPEQGSGKVFDFTQPFATFGAEMREVYFRLRRVAKEAKDAGALPDGKTYTEAQVIEILGEDYATGLVINKKCCG